MRISDWSSDVCSSDLEEGDLHGCIRCERRAQEIPGRRQGLVTIGLRAAPLRFKPAALFNCAAHCVEAVIRRERSEERRVGNECVSRCRCRWSPYNLKKIYKTVSLP